MRSRPQLNVSVWSNWIPNRSGRHQLVTGITRVTRVFRAYECCAVETATLRSSKGGIDSKRSQSCRRAVSLRVLILPAAAAQRRGEQPGASVCNSVSHDQRRAACGRVRANLFRPPQYNTRVHWLLSARVLESSSPRAVVWCSSASSQRAPFVPFELIASTPNRRRRTMCPRVRFELREPMREEDFCLDGGFSNDLLRTARDQSQRSLK